MIAAMKFLNNYYTKTGSGQFSVSTLQGSSFAKDVAGDFNPIHNSDSKRFCVPGDLMFAIALQQYGIHQRMKFDFLGLVNANTAFYYPNQTATVESVSLQITSETDKPLLGLSYSGDVASDAVKIELLLKNYVAFSGQNFPHILVPLMEQHKVMINPKRPLVIYQNMSLEFETLEFDDLEIKLEDTEMIVNGKRGNATLYFSLYSAGQNIGSGVKNLVLSSLREYRSDVINELCNAYLASKTNYQNLKTAD